MSRILFLTQVLPWPLDAGPKVRAYHMLRHLAEKHDVTLVSFVRPDDLQSYAAHLRGICGEVHTVPIKRSMARNLRAAVRGLLTGLPVVIARDDMPEMRVLLRRLVAEEAFDAIHADQLSMAWWGMAAAQEARRRGQKPATLLDEHNAIYLLAQRMAATETNAVKRLIMVREARAFRRYEAGMVDGYDAVLTVTEEDIRALSVLAPGKAFTSIPICVDPEQVASVTRAAGSAAEHAPTILHLGTMFWPPNVNGVMWFAREVLPLVRQCVPEARFVVVGKNPPPEVQALAADPKIQVTGYVSDPQPYLGAADAFVVPLHAGGGMRVKILDAWLWGLPIVSTPIGAEGILVQHGDNILLGETAAEFADATVRLLTDPGLNARLRRAGRAHVEQHYSWQAVYRNVDAVYAGLLEH